MSHTLLQCQNARLSERDVHLISYDIHKCFDSLPWQAVRSSLLACGVGEPTADALFASWSNLQRIWKLQGRFQWASFRPSNGLFQGDPTAPACLAAFLASPVQQVRQRWPQQVSVSQCADDVLFASPDAHALRAAHDFFASWLLARGVQLHASKLCKWASTAAEPVLPAFCVQALGCNGPAFLNPWVVISCWVLTLTRQTRPSSLRVVVCVGGSCTMRYLGRLPGLAGCR